MDRFARVVTEVLAPSVIVAVLPLAVAWAATGTLVGALLWGLLVALTSSVLPVLAIVWGARRGHWDSHHVRERRARAVPFVLLIAFSFAGLAVLVVAAAPWPMIALDISMLVPLALCALITWWWKISMHTAVAAGATVVLAVVFTRGFAVLALLVAIVGWSRVHLRDHTPAQALVGAAIGAAIGGGLFAMLA